MLFNKLQPLQQPLLQQRHREQVMLVRMEQLTLQLIQQSFLPTQPPPQPIPHPKKEAIIPQPESEEPLEPPEEPPEFLFLSFLVQ